MLAFGTERLCTVDSNISSKICLFLEPHDHKMMVPGANLRSAFDGGNVQCINSLDCTSFPGVLLSIREDPYTELEKRSYKQWFYFRVDGAMTGARAYFTILNGGEASLRNKLYTYLRGRRLASLPGESAEAPEEWPDSDVVYSYDRKSWRRCLDTACDESSGHLSWSLLAEADRVWFAYFAPYSMQRHDKLLDMCEANRPGSVREFGRSLDDRALHLVVVGRGPLKCWVIHRQHPGETMGGWFAEGLLQRLVEPAHGDDEASRLLGVYTFHIIPNLNPDGSFRGHLRTNAAGSNLNREWADSFHGGTVYKAPTLERSPEVYYAIRQMDEIGCDVCVDVHGDETLPYNFISGMEGVPNWGPRLKGLQGMFTAAYSRANGDMQVDMPRIVDASLIRPVKPRPSPRTFTNSKFNLVPPPRPRPSHLLPLFFIWPILAF